MNPMPVVRTLIAVALVPISAAVAQRPARPAPVPPVPPVPPVAAEPVPALPPVAPLPGRALRIESELVEELRLRTHEIEMTAAELSRMDFEHLRLESELAAARVADVAHLIPPHIEEISSVAAHAAAEASARVAEMSASLAPMAVDLHGWGGDRFERARPRQAWSKGEPADSVYRLAREALNRGEYRRAAQLFNEVVTKYGETDYAVHSAYWEAFARYRLGTTEELRIALRILDAGSPMGVRLAALRQSSVDVASLRARIQRSLAARGDAAAAQALRSQAAQSQGCDREDVSVRAEALAALGAIDMSAAMPTVRRVLANRDECTEELRRRALYLLGRQEVEGRMAIFLDVAKNDPSSSIRRDAMSMLARTADAQAVPMLEELLRTSNDENQQRYAVAALGMIEDQTARRAVRTIIERADAPERVRAEAILQITRSRNDRPPTADDAAYLRQLFPRVTTNRLKDAVITALARMETPENKQFFQTIVRNQSENTSVRAEAMQRLGRWSTPAELAQLYSVADARSLREQVLGALYQRKEPEALDRIMEIARRDTDPVIRRRAFNLIARKAENDPRAAQFIAEFLENRPSGQER